jgi:uncharacterized membrane protein YbaN (DUF454 family)
MVIGLVAVVLAIAGVFLPLLPTTPFLLLASACFARGSPRLHAWLLSNKLFGTAIRDFEAGKGIRLKVKITAVALLWCSMAWSIYKLHSVYLHLMLLVIGLGVSIYLVFIVPTRPSTDVGNQAD